MANLVSSRSSATPGNQVPPMSVPGCEKGIMRLGEQVATMIIYLPNGQSRRTDDTNVKEKILSKGIVGS